MSRRCSQCQAEMIEGLTVNVEASFYGIKIKQKTNGMFSNVSTTPNAAVCPCCGYLLFYVEEYEKFKKK